MATNFIDVSNISYCGEEANEIFSKQIFAIDLREYGVTFMDGVKGKRKIYTGEVGNVWQAYTCPFTPKGKVSLAEAEIEPVEIKVNQENCYDTFWDTFLVEQMSISLNGGIPQTFMEWYFNDKLLVQMAKEYQEIFWKGDKAYTGDKEYIKVTDGVEKLLSTKGATKVTGAVLTTANVLEQIESVIMKGVEIAGNEELDMDGYKIFMNYNDVRLAVMALGTNSPLTTQVWSNFTKEGDKIYAYGYEIVPTMQSRHSIIFGPARNLVLGFDTLTSHQEYKLIDMRESTGDNMFRVIALSNIAVGVVLPELFVISKQA